MTVALATPLSQIVLAPGSAITVDGLTWQHYELLLAELGSDRATRLTYDAGRLEIRMPSQLHEILNRLLSKIIFALAEELEIEVVDLGSTTWNRPDLKKGIEPDSCFLIQNAHRVTGLNPDIPADLPPDLAIEVDIASASDQKLAIYQALGVPELWVYQQGRLKILHLQAAPSLEAEDSLAFSQISRHQLQTWIELRETATDLAVIKAVRQYCQQLKSA
ncbi:MAG: Uma2 family endonuclease [Leptolyngbya sp. SIOISBB]|nr:Uma2 family endonuclease [Leptolyngbya sp. SIOISBB]